MIAYYAFIFQTWSSYLGSMAQEWADGCVFVHGQPPRDPSTIPYDSIGQNVYATMLSFNITYAVQMSWYDEKQFYTYDNRSCAAGEDCGHYTQVRY